MTVDEALNRLRALADPARLPDMARYGIATEQAYGVTVRELRTVATEIVPGSPAGVLAHRRP